jgi:glycosyltransferase involved in cell wall biosynthesis
VIIVDDASSDHTGFLIERFLRKNNISDKKVKVVVNSKRVTAVPNIHYAIMNHCNPGDIGFFVDGDDELISRKVFQIYNSVYQEKRPAIAYSIAL